MTARSRKISLCNVILSTIRGEHTLRPEVNHVLQNIPQCDTIEMAQVMGLNHGNMEDTEGEIGVTEGLDHI